MSGLPLLSLLTLTPLAGALVILALGRAGERAIRRASLGISLCALLQALHLWVRFDPACLPMQFSEEHRWIPALAVHYVLGLDGLGLLMVLLAALVVPLALALGPAGGARPGLFHSLVLLLQSGLFGAFTALNFFHWFIFWELSLVPAFFLIRLWGGPRRAAAATQFFVYTLAGSVAMLLAFQVIYLATDSFDFQVLGGMGATGELARRVAGLRLGPLTGHSLLTLVFLGLLLGFAVKVPLVPFHTWLPAAYAEAPTGVTMILTGALSKMGLYGLLRVLLPMFPGQVREWLAPLLGLAAATVILPAWAALAQSDLKRLLAYSSVNHLGYCLLAIFAVAAVAPVPDPLTERSAALNGAVLQMFNHGLTAATLFFCVGLLEQRSGGLRGLADFGGLRQPAPVLAGMMGIALFASIGLPGLNGFVGEFLIFKGVFALAPWAAAVSLLGLLSTAVFMLALAQRVFHGPLNERWLHFADLTARERLVLAPALALMFLLGLWPQVALGLINPTLRQLAESLMR